MYQLQQERRLPGTEQWKIRIFTPGEQPLVSFATAFLDEEVTDIERARQLKAAAEAIAALLVRTPVSRDRTSAGKIVQPFFKLLNRFPNCSTVFSVYRSLLIMQGQARTHWSHELVAVKERRISVTFRSVII